MRHRAAWFCLWNCGSSFLISFWPSATCFWTGSEQASALVMEAKIYKVLILPDSELFLMADRQASAHLANHYLRGVEDGEELLLASRLAVGARHEYVIKAYMLVRFLGNRFVPDSAIPSMSSYHCMTVAEYEVRRSRWAFKRDGAVAWQFDILEPVGAWAWSTAAQDVCTRLSCLLCCHCCCRTVAATYC